MGPHQAGVLHALLQLLAALPRMTLRVAYLSAECMQKGSAAQRKDYWEHDLQFGAMQPACAELDISLETVVWDHTDWLPRDFAGAVIGTPWDYMERPDAFLQRLEDIARQTPLFNDLDTVRWNLDKGYLQDLAQRGAPSVPTHWLPAPDREAVQTAFDTWNCDTLVIKPRVGAGAWRQAKVQRGAPWPHPEELPPAACLVQPFLPSVATEGEYSFVFFGGVFCHALRKVPQSGDYRVQSIYGAQEQVHPPSSAELAAAQSVLACLESTPLYARVDMVRGLTDSLVVMELEMIEPYLYPEQGPDLGPAFARALRDRLSFGRAHD